MMKTIYTIVLAVVAVVVTSCQFGKEEWVDFANIEAAKNLSFRVIGQHETDLSQGWPADCYMPGGTPVNEWTGEEDFADEVEPMNETAEGATPGPCRTSSVTVAAILQQLLKWGNQSRVIEISGTYPSIDADWNPITISGKVLLPKGRKPKRMILVSHYTICSNSEAPSNCFPLEGILVNMGYGMVVPDYIGYGVTAKEIHPYLVMDLTARNVVDMYLAVRPWLKAVGMEPEYEDIYLMGYSQGGATTMAVQRLIETEYFADEDSEKINIHRVFAGGGPYDVKATYERFVNTDTASYPIAVPLVLQGMIKGNNLSIKMEDMMQPWLCEHLDEWINSKRYTTGQVNKFIGTKVTHNLLTKEAMDQRSEKVAELYKAMTANSIISYNWFPLAPVYMLHSIDDETVPYQNASNAQSKWHDANITYNFGHYGGHIMTCLRFIYSVQSLLQQEEKERSQYEN